MMKAIIEHPITFYDDQNFAQSLMEFAIILQNITTARTIHQLIANLDYSVRIGRINNFKYGLGGSHLWVKQLSRDRKETKEQVVFVKLK